MKKLIEELADEHVANSIADMRDESNHERWMNGDRAKEQTAAIVARIIADGQSRLTEEKPTNES